jgi:lysyl-tRNA synthetase class 2
LRYNRSMAKQRLEEIRKIRLGKAKKLLELGIEPYPSKAKGKVTPIEKALKLKSKVGIAGRIWALRTHGNVVFADVKDESGQIQLWFQKNTLKENFKILKYFDIGDFIYAEGKITKTKAGETTLDVSDFQLLTKSIRPLPSTWSGFKDVEERYRQRYVDLLINPKARQVFEKKAKVVKMLRKYLNDRGFIEVKTPALQPLYGGATAKPFITHHNALDTDLYLRIADELYLKRLVVGGFNKVYEICTDFRNEGIDRWHNPEFTMLEFYWAYADYNDLMDMTEDMLSLVAKEVAGDYKVKYGDLEIDFKPPWKRLSLKDVIYEKTKVDIDKVKTFPEFKKVLKEKNIKLDLDGVNDLPTAFDNLYKQEVRPNIIDPTFIIDHPYSMRPLAKRKEKDREKAQSLQPVVAGAELLNAYSELNDPQDQRARWEEDMQRAQDGSEEFQMLDEDYIRALEYAMPPTAGWGMGIDRFTAILTNQHSIKDTILFPTLRPENSIVRKKAKTKKSEIKDLGISYKKAKELVKKYIKDDITRLHLIESEAIMRALAKHFGEDEEKWGIIGLLHDIDWDLTKDDTSKHCVKMESIIKDAGGTDFLVKTIQSHGYGMGWDREKYYGPDEWWDKKRKTRIQHALASAETLTGLVVATALVRPDKKLQSVKTKSLKKKFKNKKFAANCNRRIMHECEEIGLSIDEFLEIGLKALQNISSEIGL